MMKRRTLQVCGLKHSIKKGITTVMGKINLFRLGRGEPFSSSPPWLRVCIPLENVRFSGIFSGVEIEHWAKKG